jgi:ribonuclease HII
MDIIGVDEAGRGPLAGPVVAAAVMVKKNAKPLFLFDSKKMTAKQREKAFQVIKNKFVYKWASVSPAVIDKINILQATKLAMRRCLNKMPSADLVIIDGNFVVGSGRKEKSVIKGDEKIYACRLASIVAKVVRDKKMVNYDKKWPNYGFQQHKGYPTKYHYIKLAENGPILIHRRSFLPRIKNSANLLAYGSTEKKKNQGKDK